MFQIRNLRDEGHRRRNPSSKESFSKNQEPVSLNEKTLQVTSETAQTSNKTIQNPTIKGQDRAICLNPIKNASLIKSHFLKNKL